MSEDKKYYIISLKHTSKGDTALTFWCHNSRGYSWDKERAGLYSAEQLPSIVNEDNVAVEQEKVDRCWIPATDFGDKYVAVPNNRSVHQFLKLDTSQMKEKRFASCRMQFDKKMPLKFHN